MSHIAQLILFKCHIQRGICWRETGLLSHLHAHIHAGDKSYLERWLSSDKKCLSLSLSFECVYYVCHHHHHVVPPARISQTLSRHFSLSFIASGRSLWLHPISSHSCCMYVLAGCPAFARSYVGVHRSTSLMSLSLLLQQCPACLVRLTLIVFVMGGCQNTKKKKKRN